MLAIVDARPLYATVDADDQDHRACRSVLARADLRLVIPALVVAEATYFIGRRLGPAVEARFLHGLGNLDVEAPTPEDFDRIAQLVEIYADVPLGGTDASIIALAERTGTQTIVTLDRRHFTAVKPRHCDSFALLP